MKPERKVKKSSLRKLERFCEKLEAFRVRTGDEVATLYEDAYTWFTRGNVRIENGFLLYEYDGVEEREDLLLFDEETGEYYESECDGVGEYVKFWSACLRRAVRYWEMDTETLDAIQDGVKPDDDDNEEE